MGMMAHGTVQVEHCGLCLQKIADPCHTVWCEEGKMEDSLGRKDL